MTTLKVMLGAVAVGSLATAAAVIWLVVARPDRLLWLICSTPPPSGTSYGTVV
jgi:hypothetical protein